MSGFRPYKPRQPGTIHAVITEAFDQAGGLEKVADVIQEKKTWCYAAADEDIEARRAATLSYAQARTLGRLPLVSAFAEDMALLAGGAFLPLSLPAGHSELQAALAVYSVESGEAIATMIRRAADGVFDRADARSSLKEIDEALRALMALRAFAVRVAEN